ncbi:cell envelope integrity protein CreD [Foetidibacter luteolus]|uniref:cell envelope integrity protein CreD n=1 Tax=Foetidibacter luteolus TaxID=2608880 RepID=UPI001A98F012|nr:cell envelope integrity protein CreD [Foetidibacter luteolus]
MSKEYTDYSISARLWFHTVLTFTAGVSICFLIGEPRGVIPALFVSFFASLVGSLPVLIVYFFTVFRIEAMEKRFTTKVYYLVGINFLLSLCYGVIAGIVFSPFYWKNADQILEVALAITTALFTCSGIAILLNLKPLKNYFGYYDHPAETGPQPGNFSNQTYTYMETSYAPKPSQPGNNNKVLIKACITGALILVMLIPTVFVQSLVQEREQRQKEIVEEVSSKWASAQTISGPYIVVPHVKTDEKGLPLAAQTNITLLPEELSVNGQIIPEQRPRSIYKVLLYHSDLNLQGNFKVSLPKDINPANLKLDEARLCIGIKDFKGIEEKVAITFNGARYTLSPGLPTNPIDTDGLSVPIPLTSENLLLPLSFAGNIKIRGSEQLHFMPLSANSTFSMQSEWPSPSFNGYGLPTDYTINSKGFNAVWKFNQANLPFSTVITGSLKKDNNLSFGVSMVQPADQYAQTMRSAKYAVLIIGLSFALFFITELMQNKPVHPVQYILVGFALVIFYTLLLSISELIRFVYAYGIAATATIALITMYVKSHFKNWKPALAFTSVLTLLYAFIFVLISLEDTSLLIGSIGLFIILALIMYASRKINWYNPALKTVPNDAA